MGNSNVISFTNNQSKFGDFDLMHNLLRYVYAAKKTAKAETQTDSPEQLALQQTYYCRAALKRRLKQIAMYEHELHD